IKLPEEDDGDSRAAGESNEVSLASLLCAQIEQHDDEKEQNHHRAGIDEHLNDADEKRVERQEERGQSKEGNDQAERARPRIAINDDGSPEDEHQRGSRSEEHTSEL